MIVALFAVGAAAAALGTRGAAAAFLAAAGLAVWGTALPALVTWVAVTAAVLVLADRSPRRIGLPALGAAAVIAAGSARNAAGVFGLWVLGTVAAVVSRGESDSSDRWAVTLCLADLPVLAAVTVTGFRAGFEGWPSGIDGVGVALLVLATVVRAPLASGPDDDIPGPGLLVVRTQSLLLPLLAIESVGPDSGFLTGWLVLGAAGMALGGVAGREATRDALQEVGLLAIVVAAAKTGVGVPGWEWGVVAGATLMHTLRLRVESQAVDLLAAGLLRGGGVGLPILPAAVVALEGGIRHGSWAGAAVALGVAGGLAGRAARIAGARRVADRGGASSDGVGGSQLRWTVVAGGLIAVAAVAVALWAPALTWPDGSAGRSIEWPPLWAGAAVLAVGVGAARLGPRPRVAATTKADRGPGPTVVVGELRVPVELSRPRMVLASAVGLGVSAVTLWIAGVVRGFL